MPYNMKYAVQNVTTRWVEFLLQRWLKGMEWQVSGWCVGAPPCCAVQKEVHIKM